MPHCCEEHPHPPCHSCCFFFVLAGCLVPDAPFASVVAANKCKTNGSQSHCSSCSCARKASIGRIGVCVLCEIGNTYMEKIAGAQSVFACMQCIDVMVQSARYIHSLVGGRLLRLAGPGQRELRATNKCCSLDQSANCAPQSTGCCYAHN